MSIILEVQRLGDVAVGVPQIAGIVSITLAGTARFTARNCRVPTAPMTKG
ncbi:hypothetical protein [Solimonas sp. SE-A11]|nr:hypothetical protein [Solimonas sp. SE-A11]MDM4771483.1 hypothetical protein [Solimonas sp. SE-A11]